MFLIDFDEVNIYFVTRNLDLARLLAHMMSSFDIPNVFMHLYYTKVKTEERFVSTDGRREIILARPDFRTVFSHAQRNTCVYYCGNYRLRGNIQSHTLTSNVLCMPSYFDTFL